MRPILIFLAIVCAAFSYDCDPLFLVDGHIDVRTGDWIQREGHAIYRSTRGSWQLSPHTHLVLRGPDYMICEGCEKTGLPVTYRHVQGVEFAIEIPARSTNTAMGCVGARTFLGNQTLIRPDKFTLLIETPQKTRRIYKKAYNKGLDLYFLLQEEVLADGTAITYSYDREGNLYTIDGKPIHAPSPLPDLQGQVSQHGGKRFTYFQDKTVVKHPDGSQTLYLFDSNRRLSSIQQRGPTGELVNEERYLFSEAGCLLKKGMQSYTYDARGNPIEESIGSRHLTRTFDGEDRILTLIDQKGADRQVTTYTYNANGLLTQVVLEGEKHVRLIEIEGGPDTPTAVLESVGDTLVKVTRYTYEGAQIWESIYDPDGALCLSRLIQPSQIHRPWLTHYPTGIFRFGRTEIERDPLGRVVAKRVCHGQTHPLRQQTWKYNACHLVSYTSADGLTTSYAYDTAGQIVEKTLHTSQGPIQTQLIYDALGQVSSATCGEVRVRYMYDSEGQMVERREETLDGQLLTINPPQVKRSILSIDLSSDLSGVDLARDCFGNITSIVTEDGTVHYEITYNERNQPIRVVDHVHDLEGSRMYDDLGNLVGETLLNGLTLTSRRDLYGRRLEHTLPDQSKIYCRWGVKFPCEMRRMSRQGGCDFIHQFIAYDSTGIPVQQRHIGGAEARCSKGDGWSIPNLPTDHPPPASLIRELAAENLAQVSRVKTDGLGRVVEISHLDKVVTFTYDPWNRRMTKTTVQKEPNSRYQPVELAFIYDDTKEIGVYCRNRDQLIELRIIPEMPHFSGQVIGYELCGRLYLPQF